MASLNTLRTKGGVIVSIVIGIALLAFIVSDATIMDFLTGGGSARDPKLGEIAGAKVKYSEFTSELNRFENINRIMNGGNSSDQYEYNNASAWESLVMKHSYLPGFENLGITASEAERIDMTSGVYLSPLITQTFVNSSGMYDPSRLRGFIEEMEATGDRQSMMIWAYIKEQAVNHRIMQKYIELVSKSVYVSDLEVRNSIAAEKNTYDIVVVSQNYNTIADSLIDISNADIRKYYNERKETYKQIPSRDIEYVVFDILPSEEDYTNAQKRADELAQGLTNAVNPAQFASLNSPDDRTPAIYVAEDKIPAEIAEVVLNDPDAIYGPVLKNDTYTIARLGDSKMLPDQISASHILLPLTEKTLADSIYNAVRGGADFAVLAREYSYDGSTAGNGGDMGEFAPETMELELPEFTESVLAANTGDILMLEAPYGIQVIKVNSKTAPVRKYKIATIKYTVKASSATQAIVLNQAQKFYAEAAGSTDNFQKAITENVLTKRYVQVKNTDRNIAGFENSGQLVRWAFNNKRGSVSEPIAVGLDHYIIANVTDVKNYGIAPVEQVAQNIKNTLIRQRKGDMIAEQLQGKTIADAEITTGTEAIEIEGVRFAEFYLHGVGVEPRLVGAVTALDRPGIVSKPVKGNSAVYLFQITERTEGDVNTEIDERVKLEANTTSFVAQKLFQAMEEESNIKDERVKYL